MVDAPERVWVLNEPPGEAGDVRAKARPWFSGNPAVQSSYIRADLVPRRQPIASAPQDGTEIVLQLEDGSWEMGHRQPGGWYGCRDYPIHPAHWMPLPGPAGQGAGAACRTFTGIDACARLFPDRPVAEARGQRLAGTPANSGVAFRVSEACGAPGRFVLQRQVRAARGWETMCDNGKWRMRCAQVARPGDEA